MRRIKAYLTVFFLAVTLPSGILLYRSFLFLEREALYSHREKASLFTRIINKKIVSDMTLENRRSYAEYRFLMVVRVIGGEEIILSPLASINSKSPLVGLVGYFQIDPNGSLTSPVLPEGQLQSLHLEDRLKREKIKKEIAHVIQPKEVLEFGVIQKLTTRSLDFDRVKISKSNFKKNPSLGKMINDSTESSPRYEMSTKIQDFIFDVETGPIPHKDSIQKEEVAAPKDFQDVEVQPFQATFKKEYLIFHRNVLRGGQKFVQGFVVRAKEYFTDILKNEIHFNDISSEYFIKLSHEEQLIDIYGEWYSPQQIITSLFLQAPLQSVKMDVGYYRSEYVPGSDILIMLGGAIVFVLVAGIFGIYRILRTNFNMTQKRSDFISAVSHELKTPLTAIRMYSEMLEEGFVPTEDKKMEYYKKISSESNRLSRLIKNILDLSRLERQNWEVHFTPEILDDLIKNYCDTFGPQVADQNFELILNLNSSGNTHMIDRDGFSQIMINLIENSMKFGKNSEKRVIEISSQSFTTYSEITLRDYGPGVPSGELNRIFDPFYRVEKEMIRQTSGTGIGLSLVKELCRAMNIKVEAKNTSPGLMISFVIPTVEI